MRRKADELAQGHADAGCRHLWQAVILRALEDIRSPIAPANVRTDQTVKYVSRGDRDSAIQFFTDESKQYDWHRRVVFDLAGITNPDVIREAAERLIAGLEPETPEEGWLF